MSYASHTSTKPASCITKIYIQKKHDELLTTKKAQSLDMDALWKAARQTQAIRFAFHALQKAMGSRQRCMYCVDSHGTDIEHFRPKALYRKHAFRWSNWLLCCTECGRIKGSQFPTANGKPSGRALLIDPTSEDPWKYIDFDPDTGNLMARFDLPTNSWLIKGKETVRVLQLDRREALAAGYQKTFQRLSRVVNQALTSNDLNGARLIEQLQREDDHGLLGWCFGPSGVQTSPFKEFKAQQPKVWALCKSSI